MPATGGGPMLTPSRRDGGDWTITTDPVVLLPDRPVTVHVRYRSDRPHRARGVRAVLRCIETYQYRATESSGETTRQVTRTGHDEVVRVEAALAGPSSFAAGHEVAWDWTWDVPGLGPATFEGSEVLRCDWSIEVIIDVPWGADDRLELPVRVAQPMALLRAGVIDAGQYALFEDAPANVDAYPAQIRIEPVPLSIADSFRGVVRVETAAPIEVQEVRLELRVHVAVSERGRLEDELLIANGRLVGQPGQFGGTFAEHPFTAAAPGVWTPTVDLRHGTARARFHVILALAWRADIHYVRDVALASTTAL